MNISIYCNFHILRPLKEKNETQEQLLAAILKKKYFVSLKKKMIFSYPEYHPSYSSAPVIVS
jgi:hypothetical protein